MPPRRSRMQRAARRITRPSFSGFYGSARRRPARREVTDPFILLADCQVTYEGRASSVLPRGHYLLVRKADGSFLVHGARLTTPLNYQGAGSRLFRTAEGFWCQGKKAEALR